MSFKMKYLWPTALAVGTYAGFVQSIKADVVYRYVRQSAPTGGDGESWNTAFKFPQDALESARRWLEGPPIPHPNDTVRICIAAGSYRPDQAEGTVNGETIDEDDRTESFHMRNRVELYGGFSGAEPEGAEGFLLRDYRVNQTILTGSIGVTTGQNHWVDNSFHVVTAYKVNQTARLDGVWVADGFAVDAGVPEGDCSCGGATYCPPWPAGAGGGLLIYGDSDTGQCGSKPVITRVHFLNNFATNGGGVCVAVGQWVAPTFSHCAFQGNSAQDQGGGIYVWAPHWDCSQPGHLCSPQVCQNNNGKCFSHGGRPLVVNSLFHHNWAWGGGGAVATDRGASIQLLSCTIADSTAVSPSEIHLGDCVDSKTPGGNPSIIKSCIVWNTNMTTLIRAPGGCGDFSYLDLQYNCITGYPTSPDPNNNFGLDPMFGTGYRLTCPSASINSGLATSFATDDTYDLNQNGTYGGGGDPAVDLDNWTNVTTPRIESLRLIGTIDRGCFEKKTDPRHADVGSANCGPPDGVVNVSDLLCVINSWGPCSGCAADIAPAPCGGDGVVNVSDLLMVINLWGPCASGGSGGGMPQTIADCFNVYCTGLSGAEWQDCINKCVEAVCSENPSECE